MSPSMASTLDTESATIGYLYTAFAMMIVYDHALCLRQEIELFWRTKFVWPTWIFLSNRYILLLYGVSCLLQVPLWTTPLGCAALSRMMLILNILELVVMRAWVTEASANVAYTSYIFVPLSPMFVNHFLIGLRQLSYADSHSGLPDMESTRTTTYGSSLATMGGHIKFGLHFATPSVTREESTQGEWNDLERSTEDDIEMHIMTS
ncbi:hypothetical protein FOMPIDRAFT_1045911 [Fomitopsis schrenkii]|uniref:DUF6533 domain-containing protein n=1 Tax=Fomitopsis schrenkii TaxID=2126942 RepID=S8EK69_FOMSC|nr:hypothetical protein FOMPIDRAFT_1045911 [Fomitopsis schrenkii]